MNDVVVTTGSPREAPPIAVVIISTHSDPRTAAATDSILSQGLAAEIVVVNSGLGSVRSILGERIHRVTLVETRQRKNVGAARNLGLLHTRAPYVAFLASDCVATPGWLERRMAAHHQGHAMVASALRPLPDASGRITAACWAAYATSHTGRMPETPPGEAARYGVSYARSLFARYGLFDENRTIGEDTDFHARCCEEQRPLWDPAILTLHDYPRTVLGAAADQFRRGRLSCLNTGKGSLRQLVHSLGRAWIVSRRVSRRASPGPLRTPAVRLLMVPLLLCHVLGVLSPLVAGAERRS